jgi:predicted RNA-binding Zn-ribbon protein involved in translation (DUF1610 family)
MKEIPQAWQLSGLTNEEGDLRVLLGSNSRFFLPPQIEVVSSDHRGNPVECIKYPVPEEFMSPMILRATADEIRGKLSLSSLPRYGWKEKNDATGVLSDFLRLTNGNPNDVKKFVLKWGPMWLCREHSNCIWGVSASIDVLPTRRCAWFPIEPIAIFQQEAKRVFAALELFHLLWKENAEPVVDKGLIHLWLDLGTQYVFRVFGPGPIEKKKQTRLRYQKYTLLSKINSYLSTPGGAGVGINCDVDSYPTLKISTGWGFISAVWLEVAATITQVRNVFECDGCHKTYIRKSRKPREGESNYCPNCGVRAAKRKWARQKKNSRLSYL